MPILVIDRDARGRIAAISKRITMRDALPMAGMSIVILVAGVLCEKIAALGDGNSMFTGRGIFAGFALAALGLCGVLLSLTRLIPGHPILVRIADPEGIAFRYFPRLGTVPWSAITDFSLGSATGYFIGKTVLVANFRDAESFSAFARKDMPIGTVEGSQRLDLAPLQSALEELKRQTAAAPAPFTPPPVLAKTSAAKKQGAAFWMPFLLPLLVFAIAMAYRRQYGLQALRQIRDPATGSILLLGVLVFFALSVFRRFKR
jgi:hypothetical protein